MVPAGAVPAGAVFAAAGPAGLGTLSPAYHGKHPPPVKALPRRAHLDLRAHGRTSPAFITRGPAAIFHLARALGRDGVLPVLPQPVAVKSRVQVIPREHLAIFTFARSIPCKTHRLGGQGLLGGLPPALEREVLAPPVEPRAVPPRRQDHAAHPAVTPGQQALDDPGLAVVIAEADRLGGGAVGADRAAERAQPGVDHLGSALRRPLERRVRLGHEP